MKQKGRKILFLPMEVLLVVGWHSRRTYTIESRKILNSCGHNAAMGKGQKVCTVILSG